MRFAAILLGALALTACGAHAPRSPEEVARAWSAALDKADDDKAAGFFAPGAQIVQNGALTLSTHADAVRWNDALPCGGEITKVEARGIYGVLVTFHLTDRPGHRCDSPGHDAAALFRVKHGKIVLWFQTSVPQSAGGPTI
jgi:hypothetical protein